MKTTNHQRKIKCVKQTKTQKDHEKWYQEKCLLSSS
jgi:hypothetical protein